MDKLSKEHLKIVLDCMVNDEDDILNAVLQDSDDEEELLMHVLYTGQQKKPRINDFMQDVFPSYSEDEFRAHFRVKRSLFEALTEKFEATELYQNLRADKRCSANKHIAVFLWFAGHEMCSFRDLAKRFGLSISTVSAIIERTVTYLSSLCLSVVKWPNDDQKRQSSVFFTNQSGFSKAIGCIDGTHIAIERPNESDSGYFDSKGNASVHLQAVCNEEKKFIDIFVGCPGSLEDSLVYQNSPIHNRINSICGDYYLLGDSAYPCCMNLITPYRDNGYLTSGQKRFNEKLNSSRIAIEHTFSMLKQRFPQLRCLKLRDLAKVCLFVKACCVLHNMADEDDLDFSLDAIPDPQSGSHYPQHGETARGNIARDAIYQELQEAPMTVTNKQQMEILITFMEANPDMVKGICMKIQAKRWQDLTTDLNSHGPPIRTWIKWAQIWMSFKYQVKKKIAENKLRKKSTGDRSKKLHSFNEFEKKIASLVDINTPVDPLADDFGEESGDN